MKNKVIFILSLLISITLLVTLLYSSFNVEQQIIGGERDEHGCLGPAGYTYNETLEVCVREWELDSIQRQVIKLATSIPKEYGSAVVNVSRDNSCLGCFSVRIDLLGHQRTIGIYSWNLINTTLSPEECIEKGGRNLNIVAGDDCYENETNIAKVIGFISPNICCTPKNYCGEDRGDYCIQVWDPVCGFGNFTSKTFSNGCVACLNISVEYYVGGEC